MRYRLDVAGRMVAAVAGGYALANLLSLAIAGWLPLERHDTVTTALAVSFAVHAAAVLWAFAARSAWQAWSGILLSASLAGVLLAVQGR